MDKELTPKYVAIETRNGFEHHGILGMHWGIRRFQPYPKGKKVKGGKEIGEAAKSKARAESASNKSTPKASTASNKTTTVKANKASSKSDNTNAKKVSEKTAKQAEDKPAAKKLSEMSDNEIRDVISRMELEDRYTSLMQKRLPKNKASEAKKMVSNMLKRSAENIGGQLVTYAMGTAVNKTMRAIFKEITIDVVNPYQGQANNPNNNNLLNQINQKKKKG